jgi:hypothetical protein
MTILQVAELPKPSKEFKDFCNNLRCPLCDSQLDGNVHPTRAVLFCVANNKEYSCVWIPGAAEPDIETIRYWYPQYEYEIFIDQIIYGCSGIFHTSVTRFNADVQRIYRESTRKVMFENRGARMLFFRKRMEEEVFLKKLKTYNVFS